MIFKIGLLINRPLFAAVAFRGQENQSRINQGVSSMQFLLELRKADEKNKTKQNKSKCHLIMMAFYPTWKGHFFSSGATLSVPSRPRCFLALCGPSREEETSSSAWAPRPRPRGSPPPRLRPSSEAHAPATPLPPPRVEVKPRGAAAVLHLAPWPLFLPSLPRCVSHCTTCSSCPSPWPCKR